VKRILFIVSEDWYFVSHRLHLAVAAAKAGFHVGVLTRVSRHRSQIEAAGIEVIDWSLDRGSRNPVLELRAVASTVAALRRFRPHVLHAVALKPVLYAALASSLVGPRARVFALGGLGFTFSSTRRIARLVRPLARRLLGWALRGASTRLVLQNPQDQQLLLNWRAIEPGRVQLIRGAGVDTTAFALLPEPSSTPLVVLPARMLWDKGVGDFVEAARCVRARGLQCRFALIGDPDPHNPESVPETQLRAWHAEGVVEWWGRRDDMPSVYAQAAIVCLPSYHEGLPKSLLEAASSGRAMVTYDIAGCREVVVDGENGRLVPLRDTASLAQAIEALLRDADERRRMGENGRSKVLREFSQEIVAEQTLKVWREVLA